MASSSPTAGSPSASTPVERRQEKSGRVNQLSPSPSAAPPPPPPPPAAAAAALQTHRRRGPKPQRDPAAIYFGSSWGSYSRTFPLSNMAPCRIMLRGITYPTSEHLYHAERLRRAAEWAGASDAAARARLLEGVQAVLSERRSPKRAKEVSRLCYLRHAPAGFVAAFEGSLGWQVMWEVQLAKYEADTDAGARARRALLGTGDAALYHVANGCPRWGVDGAWLEGGNQLGLMLVEVRQRLRRRCGGSQPVAARGTSAVEG